jgi:hypothetical protein
MLRNALWAVLCLAALLTAGSCADGAEDPSPSKDGGDSCPATCGNGMHEPGMGEVCENVILGTVATTQPAMPSCEQMGMGRRGTVLCDACCMWDFSNCMDAVGGMGGSSSLTGSGGVGGGN